MKVDELTQIEEKVYALVIGMANSFLGDLRCGHVGEVTPEQATLAFHGYWKAWETNSIHNNYKEYVQSEIKQLK